MRGEGVCGVGGEGVCGVRDKGVWCDWCVVWGIKDMCGG